MYLDSCSAHFLSAERQVGGLIDSCSPPESPPFTVSGSHRIPQVFTWVRHQTDVSLLSKYFTIRVIDSWNRPSALWAESQLKGGFMIWSTDYLHYIIMYYIIIITNSVVSHQTFWLVIKREITGVTNNQRWKVTKYIYSSTVGSTTLIDLSDEHKQDFECRIFTCGGMFSHCGINTFLSASSTSAYNIDDGLSKSRTTT